MNNLLNGTYEKKCDFLPEEKIIRIKSVQIEDSPNYNYCDAPVTYIGEKNGHIITQEYGVLDKIYSDDNWIDFKSIMIFGEKTELSKSEKCFIRRTDSLRIGIRDVGTLMFGIDVPKNVLGKNDEESILLLKATKKYLVVVFEKRVKILDERYTNPDNWIEVEEYTNLKSN